MRACGDLDRFQDQDVQEGYAEMNGVMNLMEGCLKTLEIMVI